MKNVVHIDDAQQAARQAMLETGFAFFNLISALPTTVVPVSALVWSGAEPEQTMTCLSPPTVGVPHGVDAQVIQAVLALWPRHKVLPRTLQVTEETLLSVLAPLTAQELYASLQRLRQASYEVQRPRSTSMWALLDMLEVEREGTAPDGRQRISEYRVTLSLHLLSLVDPAPDRGKRLPGAVRHALGLPLPYTDTDLY